MSARGKLTNVEIALAFLIGLGVMFMALAGGMGAAFGNYANEVLYGVIFAAGVLAFLSGVILWFVLVKPWMQFDDINVPKDTGHH